MRESSRKNLARAVLGGVLVTLASLAAWWALAPAATPQPHPAPPPLPVAARDAGPAETSALVVAVRGTAEYGDGDTLTPLKVGVRLHLNHVVRTGRDGRIELLVGDEGSRISVPELSTVQVGTLTSSVHGFRLERGRLAVEYDPRAGRLVRVEGPGGKAVAETRGAKFTMLSTGAVVGLATEAGTVDLWAAGKRVAVGPGQQASAVEGEAPSEAAPIPLEVLLRVAQGAQRLELCAAVKGRVRPTAEVWVDDRVVAVGADGRFQADVPRRDGLRQVAVVVRELGGATKSQLVACRPPGGSEPIQVKVDWGP